MADKISAFEAALRGVDRNAINALDAPATAEPLVSPPVTVRIKGKDVTVCFVEISEGNKQKIRYQAIAEAEELRKRLEDQTGVEWRNADMAIEELRTNRWDMLLLHAAMRDPENPSREAAPFFWVENELPSDAMAVLCSKYHEWEQGLDLSLIHI